MAHPYDWQRKDALLRAKVSGARHLISRTGQRDSMTERARRQAALAAAEEALRVHQLSKPQEKDRD